MSRLKQRKSLQDKTIEELRVSFDQLSLTEYPCFEYIHGYLSFVALIPTFIYPSEWIEELHNTLDDLPMSEEQVVNFCQLLFEFYNTLNTLIHREELDFPAFEWEKVCLWSHGFSLGKDCFSHLWEIFLEDVDQYQTHDTELMIKQSALSDKFWHGLNVSWTSLESPCHQDIYQEVRNSEPFRDLDDETFHKELIQDCRKNLSFLNRMTQGMLKIRKAMSEESDH